MNFHIWSPLKIQYYINQNRQLELEKEERLKKVTIKVKMKTENKSNKNLEKCAPDKEIAIAKFLKETWAWCHWGAAESWYGKS